MAIPVGRTTNGSPGASYGGRAEKIIHVSSIILCEYHHGPGLTAYYFRTDWSHDSAVPLVPPCPLSGIVMASHLGRQLSMVCQEVRVTSVG